MGLIKNRITGTENYVKPGTLVKCKSVPCFVMGPFIRYVIMFNVTICWSGRGP